MSLSTAFEGSVPVNYDRYLGPFLFEPYAKDLIQRLPKKALHKVLEIACGTGRVTKHLTTTLTEDGILTATDLNPDMLAVAKENVHDRRIEWMQADAQNLPFEDAIFDTVICQYGVMFFPDKLKAFKETYRVLKPGGRFLFNVWDSLDNNLFADIMVTVLKDEFGEAAPRFYEDGPFSFYDQKQIKDLLQKGGFKNSKLEIVRLQSNYKSADDMVKGFIDGNPLSAYLADREETKKKVVRDKFKEAFTNNFGEYNGNVLLQAIVCEGTK